jgi:hypothetical protein
MSVDFEFRNAKNPYSYEGIPKYQEIENMIIVGRIPGLKHKPQKKGEILVPKSDEWFHIMFDKGQFTVYNINNLPLLTLWGSGQNLHEAKEAINKVAKRYKGVVVLNELDDGLHWENTKAKRYVSPALKPIRAEKGMTKYRPALTKDIAKLFK